MEAISYSPSAEKRIQFKPQKVMPLLVMSLKNFTDPSKECILVSNRKFFVLNSRSARLMKVVQRITAKFVDLELENDATDIVFVPNTDKFLVTTGSDLTVVSITEAADQTVQTSVASVTLPSATLRVSLVTANTAAVLTTNDGLFEVNFEGATPSSKKLEKVEVSEGKQFLSSSVNHGVIAVPSQDDGENVQFIDVNTWGSALTRDWYPHGDDKPETVRVFDASSSHATGGIRVVTATEGCNEVRLWTLLKGGVATLHQTLTVGGTKCPRKLLVDPEEGYVALIADQENSVVMLELSTESETFAVRRVTEWELPSPLVCGVLFTRKIQSANNRLNMELSVLGRSAEKVTIFGLDPERLDGEANVGELATTTNAAADGANTVMKWFGQKEVAGADGSAPVISVSSSRAGPSQKEIQERAKEEAAQQMGRLAESVRILLHDVKEAIEGLQPMASDNLIALQQHAQTERADMIAVKGAERVKLPEGGSSKVDPASRERLRRLYAAIGDNIRGGMNQLAAVSMEQTLKKQLSHMGPALTGGVGFHAKDIQLPKLSSTDSMRVFTNRVERAHAVQNETMKSEIAKIRGQCKDVIVAVKKRQMAVANTTKHHLISVQSGLAELKSEIAALAAAVPKTAGTAAGGARDANAILDKCKLLAKVGSWEEAFAGMLEAANLSVMAQFLELDEVVEHRATITGPHTLSFPVVHALCQQLCHNVTSSPGLIALRIGWVHDILVGWDDRFRALKENKDPDSEMFHRCAYDFIQMSNALANLGKNDVDPATRRQLTLVKRLLSNLA